VRSEPETRYVKSGDAHIAYQVLGDGPADLIVVRGYISHLDVAWESPALASFYRRLASFCRLILFDKRGTRRCICATSLQATPPSCVAIAG
jgi:hypothetical protein